MHDLRVLRRLNAFEVWLEQRPAVTRVMSFGGLLKEADRVQSGRARGQLPRSNLALSVAIRGMQRAAPERLASHVQDDFCLGRISARVQGANADRLVAEAPQVKRRVEEQVNDPDLQLLVEPTGFVILMDEMRKYLIRSQIASVAAAFAAITLVLAALFRSWKLAIFSLIPNVGPILMGAAFMAALDIRLDPGTVMIATIALGLVVDDTCHFLVRLRTFAAKGMSLPEAIARTMEQTGRPIIYTSVILVAGFSVLLLGSFTPTVCFGLVSAFVLSVALAADLLVLPAALLAIRPRV